MAKLNVVKITKRAVDAAKHNETRYFLRDTELKGFGLLVMAAPSKVKSYIFQYRRSPHQSTHITIGKHGAITPDEARAKAEEHRATVRRGGDPVAEKRAIAKAPKVAEFLDAYLESDAFKSKAPSTQKIDRGRVERHLKHRLGKKDALTLDRAAIEKAFDEIRDGKTKADIKTRKRGVARVRGGEGTARMAIILLRAAFSWDLAKKQHKRILNLKENPCNGISLGSSNQRDTILEGKAEYTRMFQALDRLEQAEQPRIRKPIADAIRLIALTGARRGEVAGLRWGHVDLVRGLITLPPTSHKTGHKTKKPRIIGLPTAAQAIIARQDDPKNPHGPQDFVFKPAKGEGAISLSKPWRLVRKEADLPAGIGLHGLRHSLASHMAMSGAEAAEIMIALGHRQIATSQGYVHWAQNARQPLAERAAATALAGLATANVHPLKKQGGS